MVFWSLVVVASIVAVGYLMVLNVQEYMQASVSFNLETPTLSLDEIFFPSAVVCNMNRLRKSFLKELQLDTSVNGGGDVNVTFDVLHDLVESVYIRGLERNKTAEEERLLKKV